MNSTEEDNIIEKWGTICPECGVGNPENVENCIICDRDLTNIIAFFEDDPYDLEITEDSLIVYKKNFWGTERTGKQDIYFFRKIGKIEFGSPISRFIFEYECDRIVLPLREENMEKIKKFFEN